MRHKPIFKLAAAIAVIACITALNYGGCQLTPDKGVTHNETWPPMSAYFLSPLNEATSVATSSWLHWTDTATSYKVYFGAADPPPYAADVTEPQYDPGPLSHAATYYWRIESLNSFGSSVSPVWHFTTTNPLLGGAPVSFSTGITDTAFGNNGRAIAVLGPGNDYARAVVLQPDGKIILAGSAGDDFGLARLNSDGTIDDAFGISGTVTSDFGGNQDCAQAVAIQPDGKIILAGRARIGGNDRIALARYTVTGTLDAAFGAGGLVTTALGTQSGAYACIVQPDGKILAGGWADYGPSACFALARYRDDGTPDIYFGCNGAITATIGTAKAYAMALQPDGRIILAGDGLNMVRFDHFGTTDTFFSAGTQSGALPPGDTGTAYACALQPDGKIILAGIAENQLLLARYRENGVPDTGFGNNGTVLIGGWAGQLNGMALQSDHKIIVAGTSCNMQAGTFGSFVMRFQPDGILDTGFGNNGNVSPSGLAHNEGADACAVQPDGKIVAVGWVNTGAGDHFTAVRWGR
ncbi:MAG: delta-60 repeat domain-containing protein [Planctomycetota bacterium]